MKLSELLAGVQTVSKYRNTKVKDITDDTRKVKKGSVFVCIKGAHFDGHTAAKEMLGKGAVAVICEHSLGLKREVVVKDTRSAYAVMCANFFGNPAKELKLIGLTGTNGKTSSTYFIKSLFELFEIKMGLIGTMQNMVGKEAFEAQYTTPTSYELQQLFRKMADAGCEYCVMEVSSQALAQGRVDGLHFAIAIFTNLTQDHLDYHGTMENYAAAKKKLFANCDCAVINKDDPHADYMMQDLNCKVVTYSAKDNSADFVAKNIQLNARGVTYELLGDGVIARLKCPVPGSFTVYNSLCAAATAITAGLDFKKTISAFSSVKGVKGRIEVVPTDTEYTVIIDYAHSPDGIKNILSSVKEFAEGRVIIVFGCGGDRDAGKRPKMADAAASLADYVVLTSDNPRTEDPEKIVEDAAVGLKGHKVATKIIVDRTEAIRFALQEAKAGDIIVLAGKGHETYQIIGTEKRHYDEREIVKGVLAGEI
ncbi:MAG: UDP-N-acetylmuramoyl-L-alanyl-D-glutamate--2,6-diaminopimelate ligase [Clostridia bacterium]|nr:UDP-N-acetylmuramoyl-L-alanyl-D-glutamate--2,6-diaminopimelate ligase [Clostridia bacterium]